MPLNFESASVRLPQIDIIGKEVPLAAIEKTGDILQGNFDKSYENETKTQALMKRAMQDVADEDKPAAQAAFDLYQKRLGERAKKGDYHNMKWQTLQDAQEFGNIYTGLSERAKKLQQYKDAISTYKGINDPGRKNYELEKWSNAQAKTNFDTNNRVLSGLGVSAPQLVDDVDITKFLDTYGKGFESDIIGNSNGQFKKVEAGEKMANGQIAPISGFYNISTGRKVEKVDEEQIKSSLKKYMAVNPEVQAYFAAQKDYYINKLGISPEEASQKIESDIVNKGLDAAATKYGFKKDVRESNVKFDAAATANFGGGAVEDPSGLFTPGTINTSTLGNKDELDNDLRQALSGDVDKFNEIGEKADALAYMHRNNPEMLHKVKNLQIVNNQLQTLLTAHPELSAQLAARRSGGISADGDLPSSARILQDIIKKDGQIYSSAEKEKINKQLGVIASLSKNIVTNSFFDTITEDEYENFNKLSNRTIPMATFDLNSPQQRAAKESLNKDLVMSDFNVVGNNDNLKDAKLLGINKFSTESLGGGRGVVFEAQIKVGDEEKTVQLSPKNRTTGRHLIKEFSRHVYAPLAFNDMVTKGTSFYEDGQKKSIGSILRANNNSELDQLIDTKAVKNLDLMFKNGQYYIEGSNTPFSSPNQALYSLINKKKYNQFIQQ